MRCRYSGPRGKSGFGCQFERMVAAAIGSQSSPKTSQPHAARDPGPFNAHNPDGGRSGLVQHVLRSPARIPAIGISVQGSVRRAGKRKTLYDIECCSSQRECAPHPPVAAFRPGSLPSNVSWRPDCMFASSLFGMGRNVVVLAWSGGTSYLVTFLGSAESGRFSVPA